MGCFQGEECLALELEDLGLEQQLLHRRLAFLPELRLQA
jgi:hypothetical protein